MPRTNPQRKVKQPSRPVEEKIRRQEPQSVVAPPAKQSRGKRKAPPVDPDFTPEQITKRTMLWKTLPLEQLKWWTKGTIVDPTGKTKDQLAALLAQNIPFCPAVEEIKEKGTDVY